MTKSNNYKTITVAHKTLLSHSFTIISNKIIHNTNLSVSARMLLIYMLSRDRIPGWQFHDEDLMKMVGCGNNKLKELFKELRDIGYVKTLSLKDKNGVFVGRKRLFSDDVIYYKENKDLQKSAKNAENDAEKNINNNNDVTEGMVSGRSGNRTVRKPYLEITNKEIIKNKDHVVNTNNLSHIETKTHISSGAAVLESAFKIENNMVRCSFLANNATNENIRKLIPEVFACIWNEYPLKKGRKGALEKFLRLTRGITPENLISLTERIFRGLAGYIMEMELYSDAARKNPHLDCWRAPYKHGETWFSQESWDNDVYLTNHEEVMNEITNRPRNINRRENRTAELSRVFQRQPSGLNQSAGFR